MKTGRIVFGLSGTGRPQYKRYLKEANERGITPTTLWNDVKTTTDATKQLLRIFGKGNYRTLIAKLKPKPSELIERCVLLLSDDNGITLDFFAGSGTTGHAVINLNRKYGTNRKYIMVEMGDYFDSVIIPRLKKVIYSPEWKNGKPTMRHSGISHCFKYIRLESYEDSLNNLVIKDRLESQQKLLEDHTDLRKDYMLSYWLNVETADSPSLLNIEQFENPFNYKLRIATASVARSKLTRIDLIETFNYMLGLTVKRIDTKCGFKVISGTNNKDESVLVIWRNLKEKDNLDLEKFLDNLCCGSMDTAYDHIYVNGDHTLDYPHSKVKMIEVEFKRLMFDVRDV